MSRAQSSALLQVLNEMLHAAQLLEQYARETDTPQPDVIDAADQLDAAIALLRRGVGL